MRHNAVMGVIGIASCAAVVTSTMVGPMTRLRHHTDRIYSHNRRILTGVATGYIGGDGVIEMAVATTGSPRAQLLLAGLAATADETPHASAAPPEPGFGASPGSGGGSSRSAAPTPAAPTTAPPVPAPPQFPAELLAASFAMTGVVGGFSGLVTPPGSPPSPPVTPPAPPPVATDPPPIETPPVVIEVAGPAVTPPPQPVTEPSPPPAQPEVRAPPPVVTPVATVPEAATWISMLTGFALAGGALRRRRLAASLESRR